MMVAMQGVLVALLFRLQRESPQPKGGFGFFEIGIPLSVSYHGVALLVSLIAAHRFWKQQNAIALGKVYAGGWELNFIGFLVFAVSNFTLV
jgi:hypothetical protein